MSNMLNQILIEGNVVSASRAELDGVPVVEIVIATTRTYRDSGGNKAEETNHFCIGCLGNLATVAARKAKEGHEIRVVGRLKQGNWNGTNSEMARVCIVAEHIEFKPEVGNENRIF